MSRPPSEKLGRALDRLTVLIARSAGLILAVSVLLGGAALAYAATHLGLNTDTAGIIDPELPFRRAWTAAQRIFPDGPNTAVLVVDGAAPEIAEAAAADLERRLAADTEHVRDVYRPDGGAFLARHALYFLTIDELETLGDRLAQAQPLLARLARESDLVTLFDLLGTAVGPDADARGLDVEPILARLQAVLAGRAAVLSWQEVLTPSGSSDDGRRRFVVVQVRLDYQRLLPGGPALDAIQATIDDATDDVSRTGPVRVRVTGPVALAHDEMLTVARGAVRTTVLALIMVGLTLAFGLRSVRLIVFTLFTLLLGLAITAAFAALAVGNVNMISIAFAVLYVGLGVDYAIHLCLRYQELIERRHAPLRALRGCVHSVGPTLLLCTITTAIGFFAFLPTAFAGVAELGLIAGTGMFVSLGASLMVLPALLALFPLPRPSAPEAATPHHPSPIVAALTRNRRTIQVGALLLALGCAVVLPRIAFDSNPMNLQDPNAPSVEVARELSTSDRASTWSIMVLADDRETAGDLAARLEALPVVEHAVTVNDLVPPDQAEKAALLRDLAILVDAGSLEPVPSSARTPEEVRAALDRLEAALSARIAGSPDGAPVLTALRAAVVETRGRLEGRPEDARAAVVVEDLRHALLGTFPAAVERLRTALDAAPYGPDDLPPEIRSRWISADGICRVEVVPAEDVGDQAALRRFVGEVRKVAPAATGEPVVVLASGDTVIRAFVQAFGTALVAITVLLVLIRNVRSALLVLMPLLLAGAMTGAASVLLDVPFNFANVIALPLLLGIGVDSGLHIVQRMHWRTGPPDALLHSSTARAVVLSAITTICSFGNLAFSPHRGTASMGLLLTLGIVFTLFTTLLVLPAFIFTPPSAPADADADAA